MNNPPNKTTADLRRAVYWLLIVTSTFAMVGRILTVSAPHGRTPFLSANDASRWCTIRSLVDHGTFVIDDVIYNRHTGKFDHPIWNTIDKVRHRGHDGREHFYSSKPTLLTTLLAGEYWIIQKLTGATLERNPFYVGRLMLVINNVLPMLLYFILLMQLVERYGQTDWGRIFVMTCATWGTFLTTFSVTLNNHLTAAVCVMIALWAIFKIWHDGKRGWWYFAMAGLLSAFTAANELPALSFFAATGVMLLMKSFKQTLLAFVPAACLVAFGFFYTNYVAHDSWRPAYDHRKDGPLIAKLSSVSSEELSQSVLPDEMRKELKANPGMSIELSPQARTVVAPIPTELLDPDGWGGVQGRWILFDPVGEKRFAILKFGGKGGQMQLHAWDNWYEYEGSHWIDETIKGDEFVEPSKCLYAFHILIGHHGLFSLTPIWVLAVAGLLLLMIAPEQGGSPLARFYEPIDKRLSKSKLRNVSARGAYGYRTIAAMVFALSVVCVAFYISRPLADRNYGGNTCGLRWLFWLTPMWLICMTPAVDAMASKRMWRIIAYFMLAVSVLSASYASLNPWTQPWIAAYLEYLSRA